MFHIQKSFQENDQGFKKKDTGLILCSWTDVSRVMNLPATP